MEEHPEIVFCKDCKYAYPTRYGHEIDYSCTNENGLNRDVPAYGFCYYGVKDSEQAEIDKEKWTPSW